MIKDIKSNYSTFVLLENGNLWGCGANYYGELGTGKLKNLSTFQKICEDVEKIDSYLYGTFLFKKDKTLWYAGEGITLNKKSDITSFKKIANNVKDVVPWKITHDQRFLFCLKNDGKLVNLLNKKIYLTDVKKLKVVRKGINNYLFVIKNDNSLWKFDKKSFTKVFDNVKDISSNFKTPFFIQKTDNSLWKVEKDDFKKNVKLLDNVEEVKSNFYGTLILKKDGSLFALGENWNGQLGISLEKTDIPIFVTNNVKKICFNKDFSIILKNDNTLWGSGVNRLGILDKKSNNQCFYSFKKLSDNVKDFYVDENSLGIIKQNDELWGAGIISKHSQIFDSEHIKFISKDVKKVFFNLKGFFVFKKDNSLLCFGDNYCGRLGVNKKERIIKAPIENNLFKEHYSVNQTMITNKTVSMGKGL